MKIIELNILSKRNTMIPCTITLPDNQENMKLFMMAHGFCATRHENGTFTMLAEELSHAGIATIRCDFPGCNDSKEDHRFNCLENDMDNIDSMMEYMIQNYSIDRNHIGMIGYSMGGKVVLHYTKRHPEIHTVALWAPAAMNALDGTASGLGDPEWQRSSFEIAKKDGVYLYPNDFDGRMIPLSFDFFNQCLNSKANDYFSEYTHNLIMVHGDFDDIIPCDVLNKVASTVNPKANFIHHIVKGANHGFGAWTNEPHQMKELVEITSKFIIDVL